MSKEDYTFTARDATNASQLLLDLTDVIKKYLQANSFNPENEHTGIYRKIYLIVAIQALESVKQGLFTSSKSFEIEDIKEKEKEVS